MTDTLTDSAPPPSTPTPARRKPPAPPRKPAVSRQPAEAGDTTEEDDEHATRPPMPRPQPAPPMPQLQPSMRPEAPAPTVDWEARARAYGQGRMPTPEVERELRESHDHEHPEPRRVPGGFNPRPPGVRPLDMRRNVDRTFLEVERVQVNERDDNDEGADTGYCGLVRDRQGFQGEIQRKWGGGTYTVSGMYDGKARQDQVEIAGRSKQIVVEDDEDEDDLPPRVIAMPPRPPFPGQYPPPLTGPTFPPQSPGPGYPPPQGPYGQPMIIGPHGYPMPAPPPGYPYPYPMPGVGIGPPTSPQGVSRRDAEHEDELKTLRAELQSARDEVSKEREERRLAEAKAASDRERAKQEQALSELRAEFKALRSEGASKSNASGQETIFDKMLQLQLAKIDADRLAMEKEEKVRREAAKSEAERRSDEAKADAIRRAEEARHAVERADKERDRQDKFFQTIMEAAKADRVDPIALVEKLQALQPKGKEKDMTEEIGKFVAVFADMKDAFGGDGGSKEQGEIEGIIEKGGEALTGAIAALRSGGPENDPAQQQLALQQQALHLQAQQLAMQQQALQLTGPAAPGLPAMPPAATAQQVNAWQYQQAAQQAHARGWTPQQFKQWWWQQQQAQARQSMAAQAQVAQGGAAGPVPMAAAGNRNPSAEEWGQILAFVLTQYDEEKSPEAAAAATKAYVLSLGLPQAIRLLRGANPVILKVAVTDAQSKLPEGSQYVEYVKLFLEVLADKNEGRPWIKDLLKAMNVVKAASKVKAPSAPPADTMAEAEAQVAAAEASVEPEEDEAEEPEVVEATVEEEVS